MTKEELFAEYERLRSAGVTQEERDAWWTASRNFIRGVGYDKITERLDRTEHARPPEEPLRKK